MICKPTWPGVPYGGASWGNQTLRWADYDAESRIMRRLDGPTSFNERFSEGVELGRAGSERELFHDLRRSAVRNMVKAGVILTSRADPAFPYCLKLTPTQTRTIRPIS